jgi:hypothetical protein
MKCWKNLSMKKVRKVFRESWEEACEYLLMEQIVNTDGMVSFGNSTCELEAPANAAIRPVVLFPEELVTGKILGRVGLNHVIPSLLISMKYEVTHWSQGRS